MPNNKLFLLLCAVLLVQFSFSSCQTNQGEDTTSSLTTVDTTTIAAAQPKSDYFENEQLKIQVANGWQVTTTDKSHAVNIEKDNYVLFINPEYTPAGGPEGGRFSGIAMGAVGADLVITSHPSPPCGENRTEKITDKLSREDYFIGKNMNLPDYCATPTHDDAVWYFSYIHTRLGYAGWVADVMPSVTDEEWLFAGTMTYIAQSIDELPKKGSDALETHLKEMSEMVKSLEIKQKMAANN